VAILTSAGLADIARLNHLFPNLFFLAADVEPAKTATPGPRDWSRKDIARINHLFPDLVFLAAATPGLLDWARKPPLMIVGEAES
jgi:hypothetical protein